MLGAESKTPPKSTKPWNVNLGKIPLDESLTFDYEDEAKTKMCGVKLRSNELDKWIQAHQDVFNKDFENNKGTCVLWKTTPGTTSLSIYSYPANRLTEISKKKGLMVQGQETKWWVEKLYPEIKKNVSAQQDQRTRSSAKDGAQRIKDDAVSFTFTPTVPTTPNQHCATIPDTPTLPKTIHPRNLEHADPHSGSDAAEQVQCDSDSDATSDKNTVTDENGEKKTSGTEAKDSQASTNDAAFGELQKQFVGFVHNFNALKDDLISKDSARDETHAQVLKELTTQVEAAQKSLETHIKKTVGKLQNDLSKAHKDLVLQKEHQVQEANIARGLWDERIRDMSVKVDSLSASNAELQDIIKKQDSELNVLSNRTKELERILGSCNCNMVTKKTTAPQRVPPQHNNATATSSRNAAASHSNDKTRVNNRINKTPSAYNNKPGIETSNTHTRPSGSGDSVWTGNNAQSGVNDVEVRIFADSLFRDVDPDRAFQGKSTKLHRNSTITAAITNIRNMKDAATKTVILHVGSNDLDNNKHKQKSVRTTVKNTCELIEVTKQSFPNANVAVSQVLQRGINRTSALNQNIKQYNQEILNLSKRANFIYIKHKKLSLDRSLYLSDQIHLNPSSGTKHLVADVKHTLTPPPRSTPRPYVQQPNMATPWGGHRWSSQPTPPKRHNFAPVRGWSQPGLLPHTQPPATKPISDKDVITHCYPLERISATAHVSLAMDSAPRDCTGYAVKPGTDWTRDEDRAIHLQSVDSYLDKFWAVCSQTGACIKYKAEANRPPPP
ncbi:hypothetical protein Bbelb_242190 [Branchiostoma belcheri]|nr:hypothetical protein Bbelb_242190 [Branchiostoma belcheri]